MKMGNRLSLIVILLWLFSCQTKPDRNGKITLGFTITDTMNALLDVPLVDLDKGENIEVIVYDFTGYNMDSYIKPLTTASTSKLYFFRFKNERLVKYGPVINETDKRL